MNRVLSAALACVLTAAAAQSATLYTQSFAGQDGKGYVDGTSDVAGVSWAITPGALRQGRKSVFGVQGGKFTINSSDAGCSTNSCPEKRGKQRVDLLPRWESRTINAANFSNLRLSFAFEASGKFENDDRINSGDTFRVSVLAGGVETKLFDFFENYAAGVKLNIAETIAASIADAASFKIRVTANNYARTEYFRFSDLQVTGDPLTAPVPLPASALLLAGALAGMGALRRRG